MTALDGCQSRDDRAASRRENRFSSGPVIAPILQDVRRCSKLYYTDGSLDKK